MKINILVPFVPNKPNGGLRVMFEYANHLAVLGHDVQCFFPIGTIFHKPPIFKRIIKFCYFSKFYGDIPRWFNFVQGVKTNVIYSINDKSIRDADIIFSTWWSLCYDVRGLSPEKGKHFNLVQDIENWLGHETEVLESYTIARSENVVIAKYLYEYLGKVTKKFPHKLSFAIDKSRYRIDIPIAERKLGTICMLYSLEPRKGTKYGIKALEILKINNPELEAVLFGVAARPTDLPDWINYYENYQNIPSLYNKASIFIGPSNQEGCALPPMEAMYSGCAVVCTAIDGHADYAFDNETALLACPQNPEDIALKVQYLLDDNLLRIKIAEQGNSFVNAFSWQRSTKELELIFNNTLDSL